MMGGLLLSLFLFSGTAYANTYFGISGGYNFFSSPETKDYKVNAKGSGYGALVGVGKDFVGLEAFYHVLNAKGDIKHEGEKGELTMNANVIGAALRFSFQSFFLRLGTGRYSLDQKVDLATATNVAPAEDIYNVQNGSKMGVLFGIGVHQKFALGRFYLDYTRHQITSVGGYDSLSLGIVWPIPDKLFAIGKGD